MPRSLGTDSVKELPVAKAWPAISGLYACTGQVTYLSSIHTLKGGGVYLAKSISLSKETHQILGIVKDRMGAKLYDEAIRRRE